MAAINTAPAERTPTHRCTVCDALWIKFADGTWSLASLMCGQCCDNEPMGEQIEELLTTHDWLMIALAYARHVDLSVSETADHVLAALKTAEDAA